MLHCKTDMRRSRNADSGGSDHGATALAARADIAAGAGDPFGCPATRGRPHRRERNVIQPILGQSQ